MATDSKLRQSKLVELLIPNNRPPIFDLLSSYLGMGDFLVLCQMSHELSQLKDYLRSTRLNILVRDFVDHPDILRSRLREHGAVISGSFALSFFDLNQKTPNLDVYIGAGIPAEEFTNYIREQEGYEISQKSNSEVETVSSFFC